MFIYQSVVIRVHHCFLAQLSILCGHLGDFVKKSVVLPSNLLWDQIIIGYYLHYVHDLHHFGRFIPGFVG